MKKEQTFEKSMNRLEEIVKSLEKGDLSLDESLKIFEEGIKLSHVCTVALDEAEKKVEILKKEKGKTILKPFLPEDPVNDAQDSKE